MVVEKLICPRCSSSHTVKDGSNITLNGKVQKYYCKSCGRHFLRRYGIFIDMFRIRKKKKFFATFKVIVDNMLKNSEKITARAVHRKMVSRHMRQINFTTINDWLNKIYLKIRR